MVALGQILLEPFGHQSHVVVEIDGAFEVKRVVNSRVGRIELHEPVQRHQGTDAVSVFQLRISLVELRLLRQYGTGRAAFEFVEQVDGLVVQVATHIVLGLGVNLLRRHFGGGVSFFGSATGKQQTREQER